MTEVPAVLLLEDGRAFEGVGFGAAGTSFGEVVFNTAMSGYEETLTDPSYRGQIVVMTASHVGNYGITGEDAESDRIQVAAFAARHFPERFSNARGKKGLGETLREAGTVAIHGLDTRARLRRFMLVAAMNPCRCGQAYEPGFSCKRGRIDRCTSDYQARISGPLMDRIDLRIEVPAVTAADLILTDISYTVADPRIRLS